MPPHLSHVRAQSIEGTAQPIGRALRKAAAPRRIAAGAFRSPRMRANAYCGETGRDEPLPGALPDVASEGAVIVDLLIMM